MDTQRASLPDRRRQSQVPFFRPSLGEEEIRQVVAVIRSGWLSSGAQVEQFEREVRAFLQCRYAVATNSCTAAMDLALKAIGIKPGDEVITSPITFPATANVVLHQGATPVFADVEADTLTLDPEAVARAITRRTRAIMPVHFAGHPCRMAELRAIARRHDLWVVEDAAHAFGAFYKKRAIGAAGDLTCFSFYATKNITTAEGGMITTNNARCARMVRLLRLHGISRDAYQRSRHQRYRHWEAVAPGFKYNLNDIQAAIGRVQLRRWDSFRKRRQVIWEKYMRGLQGIPELRLPVIRPEVTHAYHLYVVQFDTQRLRVSREQIMRLLEEEHIGIGIHFRALHLQQFYRKRFGYTRGMFPVAERASERVISLPLYPGMTQRALTQVMSAVIRVIERCRRRAVRPGRGTAHV